MYLPGLVVHADWGSSPQKRWMARATLQESNRYLAHTPAPVGEPSTLLHRLYTDAGPGGIVLLGFDFPIGLPARYADLAGINDFLDLLPLLGQGDWADFYTVAEEPVQISLHRPFYPHRSGHARQRHLLDGLGVATMTDLRRQCDLARPGRRPACPLFWTLGGQQVGKAAIAGWKEVLGSALRSGELDVAIWPFAGPLCGLFKPGRIIVAETYPAEVYTHLGVTFSKNKAGQKSGKRVQRDRAANAPRLLAWAATAQVELDPGLQVMLQDGFGASADGDDRFDATIGLFGMLNVVLGRQPPGDPEDERVRKIEGWILGQAYSGR